MAVPFSHRQVFLIVSFAKIQFFWYINPRYVFYLGAMAVYVTARLFEVIVVNLKLTNDNWAHNLIEIHYFWVLVTLKNSRIFWFFRLSKMFSVTSTRTCVIVGELIIVYGLLKAIFKISQFCENCYTLTSQAHGHYTTWGGASLLSLSHNDVRSVTRKPMKMRGEIFCLLGGGKQCALLC